MALAGGIEKVEDFAALAGDESAEERAVAQGDPGEAEMGVDVAVGIEDVFGEAPEAAGADAVELGSDEAALAAEAVAGGAVGGEEAFALSGIGGGRVVGGDAVGDEAGKPLALGRRQGERRGGRRRGQVGPEAVAEVDRGGGGEEAGGALEQSLPRGGGGVISEGQVGALKLAEGEPRVGAAAVSIDDLETHGVSGGVGQDPFHSDGGVFSGWVGAGELGVGVGVEEADETALVGGLAGRSAVAAEAEGEPSAARKGAGTEDAGGLFGALGAADKAGEDGDLAGAVVAGTRLDFPSAGGWIGLPGGFAGGGGWVEEIAGEVDEGSEPLGPTEDAVAFLDGLGEVEEAEGRVPGSGGIGGEGFLEEPLDSGVSAMAGDVAAAGGGGLVGEGGIGGSRRSQAAASAVGTAREMAAISPRSFSGNSRV